MEKWRERISEYIYIYLKRNGANIRCISVFVTLWSALWSWKLAMGLAGGQLLGLGFVSIHHAVAGEYDLVTLLISLIL